MLARRCVYVVAREMLLSCKANHVESGSMKRTVMSELRPPVVFSALIDDAIVLSFFLTRDNVLGYPRLICLG